MTHAAGLALIGMGIAKGLGLMIEAPRHAHGRFILFSLVIGAASVLLALLHGIEASYWAAAYVWLGAAPDFRRAIYFSLQMVTTLGSDVVQLGDRWKLMGPLEAIGGMLMFGLSTAFLFAVMQRVWPFPQAMRGGRTRARSATVTPTSLAERRDAASAGATPGLPSPPAR
ncbi:MAG TPA: ion channel [Acetobacteraceae bacterium]